MPFIIVFIIAVLVGLIFPTGIGAVLFIANMILPDPIPFVDEIGMAIGVVTRYIRLRKRIIGKHKEKSIY